MKRIRYDFRRYRTNECLIIAMLKFCCLVRTNPNRMKGYCPRPECRAIGKKTCVLYNGNTVAYCYCCHRSMDALAITAQVLGTGLCPACDELEILCASALQCHT